MAIIKVNITQQVRDYLKENIRNGTWRVGGKIPSENELTAILRVSRLSVRMAIQQLIGVGVLESAHGKGTFVVDNDISGLTRRLSRISQEDCREIQKVLEFREIIEPGTCYYATINATGKSLDRLAKFLADMNANIGNSKEFVQADMRFHEEISKASGNPLLEKSLCEVFRATMRNHELINKIFGFDDGIYYHKLILEAMNNRNAEKAGSFMKKHLQKAVRIMNLSPKKPARQVPRAAAKNRST
jgi:GntR family transcriptional repressor for pyruvate dehydrogenase complex